MSKKKKKSEGKSTDKTILHLLAYKAAAMTKKKSSERSLLCSLLYMGIVLLIVLGALQITQGIFGFGEKDIMVFKNSMTQLATDMNEVREYLLFEQRDYSLLEKTDESKTIKKEDDPLTRGLYQFVNQVGGNYMTQKNVTENVEKVRNLAKNAAFISELKKSGVTAGKGTQETDMLLNTKWTTAGGELLQIEVSKETGAIKIISIVGSAGIIPKEDQTLEQALIKAISDKKQAILEVQKKVQTHQAEMEKMWIAKEISTVLAEKKLQVTLNPVETPAGWEYAIRNADTKTLVAILINRENGHWMLEGKTYEATIDMQTALVAALKKVSGQTEKDQFVKGQAKKLEALLNDSAFKEALKLKKLKTVGSRNDEERWNHDLVNTEDGSVIGRIIFEKKSGTILFQVGTEGPLIPFENFFGRPATL
jgi:hypothetical protein